jgi:hypothetical protein
VPLASVQLYVQGLLDGLLIPGSTTPLTAQVTPPVIQNLNGPVAFVWGGSLVASRQTGPRGAPGAAGFKKLMWDVDVWLVLLTNPNSAGADQQFPVLVDAVLAQLWSTTMPLFIDGQGLPATEGVEGTSEILSIGENFRMEYSPVHTPQTQRMLYYDAHLSLGIYEAVNS